MSSYPFTLIPLPARECTDGIHAVHPSPLASSPLASSPHHRKESQEPPNIAAAGAASFACTLQGAGTARRVRLPVYDSKPSSHFSNDAILRTLYPSPPVVTHPFRLITGTSVRQHIAVEEPTTLTLLPCSQRCSPLPVAGHCNRTGTGAGADQQESALPTPPCPRFGGLQPCF
jgi:hypothetical protein